jgi:hypothetical protein
MKHRSKRLGISQGWILIRFSMRACGAIAFWITIDFGAFAKGTGSRRADCPGRRMSLRSLLDKLTRSKASPTPVRRMKKINALLAQDLTAADPASFKPNLDQSDAVIRSLKFRQ